MKIRKGIELEWCAAIPALPNGDADIDRAEYRIERFATRDAAVARARVLLPKDAFGQIRLTPFEVMREGVPASYKWDDIEYGESEMYP